MLGKGIEEGTMAGHASTKDLSDSNFDAEQSTQASLKSEFVGIVPRCIADMFEWIAKHIKVNESEGSSLDYSVSANYLQIYNEVCEAISLIFLHCLVIKAYICAEIIRFAAGQAVEKPTSTSRC